MTKEELQTIVESQERQLGIYQELVRVLEEKIALYEQMIKLEAEDV